MSELVLPSPALPAPSLLASQAGVIPAIVAGAGERAARRFLEFFAATIRNPNTRAAYYRAVVRFFAWCERRLFGTPYFHGNVSVSAVLPTAMDLSLKGPTAFHAEMFAGAPGAPPRTPVHAGEDGWEGPVYLPTTGRRADRGNMFFARVHGFTEAYEFLPEDWLSLTPAAPIFEHLIASNFAPAQWLLRASAAHAKSKTYRRDE